MVLVSHWSHLLWIQFCNPRSLPLFDGWRRPGAVEDGLISPISAYATRAVESIIFPASALNSDRSCRKCCRLTWCEISQELVRHSSTGEQLQRHLHNSWWCRLCHRCSAPAARGTFTLPHAGLARDFQCDATARSSWSSSLTPEWRTSRRPRIPPSS
jgi:hypothetical protein